MTSPTTALKPRNALCEALGRRFRQMREYREVSLRQMAGDLGIALYLIRRHEAGNSMLRADKLVEAARYLRVRPAELLNVEESK